MIIKLGITHNLVIELCPPALLRSPREAVLFLCTVPPLKPKEVKKNAEKGVCSSKWRLQTNSWMATSSCVSLDTPCPSKRDGGRLTYTDSRSPVCETGKCVQKWNVIWMNCTTPVQDVSVLNGTCAAGVCTHEVKRSGTLSPSQSGALQLIELLFWTGSKKVASS